MLMKASGDWACDRSALAVMLMFGLVWLLVANIEAKSKLVSLADNTEAATVAKPDSLDASRTCIRLGAKMMIYINLAMKFATGLHIF